MRYFKVLFTVLIASVALLGDYLVFKSKLSQSQTFRALTDSVTHGTIGFLSAILFFCYDFNLSLHASVCNVLLCTFVSSFIDIDHAFVAKSIYLRDILNTKQRGFLHCTTLWFFITNILLLYSYMNKKFNIFMLSLMLTIAYTSHHIRDGNRRGLWLYPFGHTKPLDKLLYVFLIMLLPHVLGMLCEYLKPNLNKATFVNYNYKFDV